MQAALDVPRLHTQYFVLVQPEIEFVGSFETNCANLFLSHTMLHENSCLNRTLVAKVQTLCVRESGLWHEMFFSFFVPLKADTTSGHCIETVR